MAGKRRASKPADEYKYFVPPSRRKAAAEPPTVPGPKYFVPKKRNYPLPSDLSLEWNGTGPDLPKGYLGAEACPDCSAFMFSKHAALCIRNPNQTRFVLSTTWNVIRTRTQIFFGAGHPIQGDVDDYMTEEKQRRLVRAGIVVMYDFPDATARIRKIVDADVEKRYVVASWNVQR